MPSGRDATLTLRQTSSSTVPAIDGSPGRSRAVFWSGLRAARSAPSGPWRLEIHRITIIRLIVISLRTDPGDNDAELKHETKLNMTGTYRLVGAPV